MLYYHVPRFDTREQKGTALYTVHPLGIIRYANFCINLFNAYVINYQSRDT